MVPWQIYATWRSKEVWTGGREGGGGGGLLPQTGETIFLGDFTPLDTMVRNFRIIASGAQF